MAKRNEVGINAFLVKKALPKRDVTFMESKYRPLELSDLEGNYTSEIRDYLDRDLKNSKKNVLLIKGPPGCGKKTLVYLLLRAKDYNVVTFEMDDTYQKAIFLEKIQNVCGVYNNTKTVLLFLNINNCLGESTFSTVLKLLRKVCIPVIGISSTKRLSKGYRKACVQILDMDYPSIQYCQSFVNNVCLKENLNLTTGAVNYLIKQTRCPSELLNKIKIFVLGKRRPSWSLSDIKKVISFSKSDSFFNSLEFIDSLFNGSLRTCPKSQLFTDRNVIDQPFILELLYSNMLSIKSLDALQELYDTITFADIIETEIYNNQLWEFKEYSSITCIYHTIQTLENSEERPKKYRIVNNSINNLPGIIKMNLRKTKDPLLMDYIKIIGNE